MSKKDNIIKQLALLVANELEKTPYESMSRWLGEFIIKESNYDPKNNEWVLNLENSNGTYQLSIKATSLTKI